MWPRGAPASHPSSEPELGLCKVTSGVSKTNDGNCTTAPGKRGIATAPHVNFLGNAHSNSPALSTLPCKTPGVQLLPEITKNRMTKARERSWEGLLEQGSLAFICLITPFDFSGYYQKLNSKPHFRLTPLCSVWLTEVSTWWKKRRIRKGKL